MFLNAGGRQVRMPIHPDPNDVDGCYSDMVFALEQFSGNGEIHLVGDFAGTDGYYFFLVVDDDGTVGFQEGILPAFGLPLGEDGQLLEHAEKGTN